MKEKYIKLDEALKLAEAHTSRIQLHYFNAEMEVIHPTDFIKALKKIPTIDVEDGERLERIGGGRELTYSESMFFLERCKGWFPPYTPEVEKWGEAIDKAIEVLNEKKKERMRRPPKCSECTRHHFCGYSPEWGERILEDCPLYKPREPEKEESKE